MKHTTLAALAILFIAGLVVAVDLPIAQDPIGDVTSIGLPVVTPTPIPPLQDLIAQAVQVNPNFGADIARVRRISESPHATVHGTEYTLGQQATPWVQVLDADGIPFNGATCQLTIYGPDAPKTVWANLSLSSRGYDGIYYRDVTPNTTGVFMMSALCYLGNGTLAFGGANVTVGSIVSGTVNNLYTADSSFLQVAPLQASAGSSGQYTDVYINSSSKYNATNATMRLRFDSTKINYTLAPNTTSLGVYWVTESGTEVRMNTATYAYTWEFYNKATAGSVNASNLIVRVANFPGFVNNNNATRVRFRYNNATDESSANTFSDWTWALLYESNGTSTCGTNYGTGGNVTSQSGATVVNANGGYSSCNFTTYLAEYVKVTTLNTSDGVVADDFILNTALSGVTAQYLHHDTAGGYYLLYNDATNFNWAVFDTGTKSMATARTNLAPGREYGVVQAWNVTGAGAGQVRASLYINGTLNATTTTFAGFGSGATNLTIGINNAGLLVFPMTSLMFLKADKPRSYMQQDAYATAIFSSQVLGKEEHDPTTSYSYQTSVSANWSLTNNLPASMRGYRLKVQGYANTTQNMTMGIWNVSSKAYDACGIVQLNASVLLTTCDLTTDSSGGSYINSTLANSGYIGLVVNYSIQTVQANVFLDLVGVELLFNQNNTPEVRGGGEMHVVGNQSVSLGSIVTDIEELRENQQVDSGLIRYLVELVIRFWNDTFGKILGEVKE